MVLKSVNKKKNKNNSLKQGWANSGPLRVFFVARQDSQKNPP
jgi:hypothetical protein